MKIIETEDMWVMSCARRLTIPQVKQAAGELCPQIDAEIAKAGMLPREPWVFVARNLPKDSRTLFEWRACRPVIAPADYGGPMDFLRLEPIMVASATHQGPIRTLFTKGYAPLVAAISESRHTFSGESRELYHQFDGPGAGYQRIEIQFGLAY